MQIAVQKKTQTDKPNSQHCPNLLVTHRDDLVLKPLELWLGELESCLDCSGGGKEKINPDQTEAFEKFLSCLNNFTLAAVFAGRADLCLQVYRHKLAYHLTAWYGTGDQRWLAGVLQPLINLTRLWRSLGKPKQAARQLALFNCFDIGKTLGGLGDSTMELPQDLAKLQRFCSMEELLKQNLQQAEFSKLQGLMATHFTPSFHPLIDEAAYLVHCHAKDYAAAQQALNQGRQRWSQNPEALWLFSFRTAELLWQKEQHASAVELVEAVTEAVLEGLDGSSVDGKFLALRMACFLSHSGESCQAQTLSTVVLDSLWHSGNFGAYAQAAKLLQGQAASGFFKQHSRLTWTRTQAGYGGAWGATLKGKRCFARIVPKLLAMMPLYPRLSSQVEGTLSLFFLEDLSRAM